MAGSARLQSLGDERYALDLAGEGVALFRHAPAGGWQELARAPLQLGQVTASMDRLRAAARVPEGRQITVEVWLPEDQVIIKPINTGGVSPVPAMIEHAFATATPEGLAGMVLDQSPRASGPMHIFAGVPRSVVEETQAFLAPHRFLAAAFTRPEPPAGLDHVPVILPPSPARASRAGLPRGGAIAAAVAVLAAAGLWWSGVFSPDTPGARQAASITTEVRQIAVAPDLAPALDQAAARPLAPVRRSAAQPGLPAATGSADPAFVPPALPGLPARAQSRMADIDAPATSAGPVAPGAETAPQLSRAAGLLAPATGSDTGLFGAILQTSVTPPEAPAEPAPQVLLALATGPDVGRAGAQRLAGPDTAAAAPDLAALRALGATGAPTIGAPPEAPPDTPAEVAALAPPDLPGALGPRPQPAAPAPILATGSPERPAPSAQASDTAAPAVRIITARPSLVPPLRPRPDPAETAPPPGAPAEALEDAVQVVAAQPDVVPPLRPGVPSAAIPEDGAAGTDPELADPLATATAETPAETGPDVTVVAARPGIVPPLRAGAAADAPVGAVSVVAARPDIVPPLRPGPTAAAPPPAAETAEDAPDIIAALIEDAGEIDLSPSANAITRRAPPPARPRAIETAEAARLEERAALAPSDLALRTSASPRGRPAGLAGPTIARVPETETAAVAPAPSAAPAPAPSTRRVPQLPTTASVARAATIDSALPLRQLALIGVYGRQGNRHALLRLPSGRYVKVQPGDSIDGFEVAAISEDAIRLRKRGRDTLLVIPE